MLTRIRYSRLLDAFAVLPGTESWADCPMDKQPRVLELRVGCVNRRSASRLSAVRLQAIELDADATGSHGASLFPAHPNTAGYGAPRESSRRSLLLR